KDDTTGLTNLGARQYQPATGRFLNPDPVLDAASPQQWNGYAYSNNNPVNLSDPSGLRPEGVCGGFSTCYDDKGNATYESWKLERDGAWTGSYADSLTNLKKYPTRVGNHIFYVYPNGTKRERFRAGLEILNWIPGLNIVASVAATVMDVQDGKYLEAGSDLLNVIPGVGPAKKIKTAELALEGINDAVSQGVPGKDTTTVNAPACPTSGKPHSFPAGTQILLADGTVAAIEDVKPGDQVLTTDPATGQSSTQAVSATITTPDDQDFTDLTVASADSGKSATTLISTQHHPFWDATDQRWTEAANLQPGHRLRLANGQTVTVSGVKNHHEARTTAYDLTVENVHTYYVIAGNIPILVHNASFARCDIQAAVDELDRKARLEEPDLKTPRTVGILDTGNELIPFISGSHDGEGTNGRAPGTAMGFGTHVEAKVAAFLRQNPQIRTAVLYISYDEGACTTCARTLPDMLPNGVTLHVYAPSRSRGGWHNHPHVGRR
ncbi:polymorphic toxin-type HINT domain-containing protein, partial [Kitasatospora sp. MBT63]|uniref:polymorphic toxin-type HINT domain-containing protein n=1 Tax=Kitasatospora sp. MBT63 TaxID=1444768 RepID=UPI0021016879